MPRFGQGSPAEYRAGRDVEVAVPASVAGRVGRIHAIDMSDVMVRRGPSVSARARQLGARGYTEGGVVHLPDEAGALDGSAAAALLAHELTHVAQQRRYGAGLPPAESSSGQQLESEAQAVEQWYAGAADEPDQAPFPDEPTDPTVLESWNLHGHPMAAGIQLADDPLGADSPPPGTEWGAAGTEWGTAWGGLGVEDWPTEAGPYAAGARSQLAPDSLPPTQSWAAGMGFTDSHSAGPPQYLGSLGTQAPGGWAPPGQGQGFQAPQGNQPFGQDPGLTTGQGLGQAMSQAQVLGHTTAQGTESIGARPTLAQAMQTLAAQAPAVFAGLTADGDTVRFTTPPGGGPMVVAPPEPPRQDDGPSIDELVAHLGDHPPRRWLDLDNRHDLEELGLVVGDDPPRRWMDLDASEDLDEVATRIYDRLLTRLRFDVLVQRERSGTLMDFR